MGLQAKCSQPIQSAFYKAFYNWGSFVGRKPKLVIFASTVLCVLGAIRLPLAIAFPLESVVEQDQLWVPQEAQAITDKNKYDAAFSTTYRRNVLQPVKGALLVLPPLATTTRPPRADYSGFWLHQALGTSRGAAQGPMWGPAVWPCRQFCGVRSTPHAGALLHDQAGRWQHPDLGLPQGGASLRADGQRAALRHALRQLRPKPRRLLP